MFSTHVERALPRYCDDELSPSERERVDAHLATCARCRTVLAEIQASARLVRRLRVVSAPPSVWNGIEAALSEPQSRPRASVLRWALASAAVLALAASVYVYWSTRAASQTWEVAHATDGRPRRMSAGEW